MDFSQSHMFKRILSFIFVIVLTISTLLPAASSLAFAFEPDFSVEATSVGAEKSARVDTISDNWQHLPGHAKNSLLDNWQHLPGHDHLEGFEPLSVDDPGVDSSRIIAWPKEEVSSDDVEEIISEVSDVLDAEEDTAIIANPDDSDKESLVIIESDEEITEDFMVEMMASGLFEAVDFDVLIEPMATYVAVPNDPYYNKATHKSGCWALNSFPGANFAPAWSRLGMARGKSDAAPIAVIDTGFYMTSADKGPNIVAGYDFGSGRTNVNPQSSAALASHGTNVAGIIGAATNNGKGIAGAAWDNKIIVYKVADSNNGIYLSAVANSINDVVAKKNARIITMSLGGPSFPSYLQQAIDNAVAANILVIASAGNNAQSGNPVLYPAAYPPVFSVASINSQGQWSSFSTYNSAVDIAAPGENVLIMDKGNTYIQGSGTSYAAPHVASAAALVWRAAPDLTATQVQKILTGTAKPIGVRGNSKTGAGALNASAAFESALGLPYQPQISRISRGQKKVTVVWNKDAQCPFPATGYILQYRAKNKTTWNTVEISSKASSYSYTVKGLKDNTTYYFRVRTVNAKGKGPYSKQATSTTYPVSMLTSKSTITIKRGKTATIRVAPHYCVKQSQTVNWSSSKPKIASVTTTGSSAQKKGKGSWKTNTITNKNVSKNGKSIKIKGLQRGTSYITFSSGGSLKRVKVVVK